MSDGPRRRLLLSVADTEKRLRLARGLREYGYGVFGAEDTAAALALLDAEPIDLIVTEPTDALETLLRAGPTLLVLADDAGRDGPRKIEQARAVIAAGAYDYLPRSASAFDLALALEKAAAREARRGDPATARFLPVLPSAADGSALDPERLPTLIAEAPRMRALLAQVRKLAATRTPVLLTGESGTGKEQLARLLHALSARRNGPLVAVNCGALPETLLESMLFGHRRGAFTDAVRDQRGLFEEAHQGTLFLDEVGELPPKLQVKLLRVLQDQQIQPLGAGSEQAISVDIRLVAATLRDLEADVASGRFRADLYYRLSVVPLRVPPLRERTEDILPLSRHFLASAAARLGRPVHGFTPEAERALLRHGWPGNVRELENTIERAAVLSDNTVLAAADLPLATSSPREPMLDGLGSLDDLCLKSATRRLETALIERALVRTRGNRSAAARLLGLSHRALLYKIRDYGLDTHGSHGSHGSKKSLRGD